MKQRRQWSERPITVQSANGHWTDIIGPTSAMDYLLGHWPPGRDDDALRAATIALIDVLDGRCTPEEAQKAFIDALRQAGIFYWDWPT